MSATTLRDRSTLVARHLRVGWWGLAVFAALGVLLELLHAIKSPLYLDAGHETTRLLLRLGHAHGTLLSMINIAYALTVQSKPAAGRPAASIGFLLSLLFLPAGFLLGGLGAHGGDPGLGVILVPPGALLLVLAAALAARGLSVEQPSTKETS